MPFIALDKLTNERVDITRISEPRMTLRDREFNCQLCGIKMILRGGFRIRFHFYHYRACTTVYKTNPETPEHIAGKYYVAERILPMLEEYGHFSPQYEVPIPEVMRVADLINEFPMGWRIAHEIQLSSITVDDLEARTADYLRAGIDVLWWFGKSADTETNRNWAIRRDGFSFSLRFSEEDNVTSGLWREEIVEDPYGVTHRRQIYIPNKAIVGSKLPAVPSIISTWWKDLAFARYYQVWRKGNNDRYKRGLLASRRTIASFNGQTAVGKEKYFHKDVNILSIENYT